MESVFYGVAVLFGLLSLGCVFLAALGLPGIWIMLGMSLLVEFTDRYYLSADSHQTFAWATLGVCFVLAVSAEILEFLAGAIGAKSAGSSKRGMIGAMIGGFVGALVGTAVPVPFLGTLSGAVLGTFSGAWLGEISGNEMKSAEESLKPALGATIGRLLGTMIKIPIAITIWITLTIAVFWK